MDDLSQILVRQYNAYVFNSRKLKKTFAGVIIVLAIICKRKSMMHKLKSFPKSWTSMIKWRNTQKKHSCCSRVLFRLDHNGLDLQSAIMLGKRCYEQLINVKRSGEIDVEPSKSKYQKPGGWRKKTISNVRQALFE